MKQVFPPHFFKPRKISIKLGLVICGLVFVLISFLGISLTSMTRTMIKENLLNNLEQMAALTAREISLFVDRPGELLRATSHLIGRTDLSAWDQETVLVEMNLDFPFFEKITSIDADGNEIASSDPGTPKQNWAQTFAFKQALKGEIAHSPIYVEDDHLPRVTIAVPYNHEGHIQGVLRAKVNLRGLWSMVDDVKIGKTGRALLIASDGMVVAHPDKKMVLKNIDFTMNPDIQMMMKNNESTGEYQWEAEATYLGTYLNIEGPLSLVLFVQIEKTEAFAILDQMRALIWFILLISLGVAFVVSFMLSRRLVRPVRLLEKWSKKISLGDFDYQIQPNSSDEIGYLFIMFKRMSSRLKHAREKEHLALIGEAATTISHKLKNIIVSLKTFSELLPTRKNDSQFMKKFESVYIHNVDYLEEVLKNLSRVSSDSPKEHKRELLDINKILRSVHDAHLETMKQANIIPHFYGPNTVLNMRGNSEEIKELFMNLIQNAIQAMPRGGLLQLSAKEIFESSLIQVQCADSGCGISQSQLDQIFKPFFTTKHGGMGLGLAISKKIVQIHSGSISIESKVHEGTRITLTFPSIQKPDSLNPTKTPSEISLNSC